MNCEKCKNKQASVFYADDSGGRHSLCASCAAALGKISQYDPNEGSPMHDVFIPDPTLTSLRSTPTPIPLCVSVCNVKEKNICPYCATALETVISKGRVGCSECYTVFADLLFSSSLTPDRSFGAKMPSSRRAAIDRTRSIKELKMQIKFAIETEKYELAAELRDKIHKLEAEKIQVI